MTKEEENRAAGGKRKNCVHTRAGRQQLGCACKTAWVQGLRNCTRLPNRARASISVAKDTPHAPEREARQHPQSKRHVNTHRVGLRKNKNSNMREVHVAYVRPSAVAPRRGTCHRVRTFSPYKEPKVEIKNTRMRAQAVISINYSAVLSCCEREGMWASMRMSDTTLSSLKRSSSSVEGQQKQNASPTKPKEQLVRNFD